MLKSPIVKKSLPIGWFLEPIKYILISLSLLAIIATIVTASSLDWDFSPKGFHKFISLYSDYSVLFAATFIIINVQLIVRQQTEIEKENRKKWQVEETNASLVQCQIYLNDIQIMFKDFIQTGIYEGQLIEWPELKAITRDALKISYRHSYEKFGKMDVDVFHQSLIMLYKLDAVASIFIHGIADIDTGKKVIGHVYCKQVGMLIGLIAYFRTEKETFQNILQLYDVWKE